MTFSVDSFFVDGGPVNVWTGGNSKSSKMFTEEQHIPDCRENKIKMFIVFCKANLTFSEPCVLLRFPVQI